MAIVDAAGATVDVTAPTPVPPAPVHRARLRLPIAVPVLSAAVLLFVVGLIFLRAAAPSDGTVVLPSAEVPGTFLRISTVLDPGSALRAGDHVLAVNGQPVSTGTLEVHRGQQLSYTVERDGAVLDVAVQVGGWPWHTWVKRNWPTGLLAVCLLVAAFHVYRRRPRDPAARALLLTAALAIAGQTAFELGSQVIDLVTPGLLPGYVLGEALLSGSFVAWLVFVSVFPSPPPWRRVLSLCAICTATSLAAAAVLAATADTARIAVWRASAISVPFSWVLPVVLVVVLSVRLHRARGTLAARYLSWLLAAFATTIALFMLVWTTPAQVRGTPLVPWEYLALAFLPCPVAFGAAVLRFGLFDVKAVAGRSLLYGLLTLALGTTYVGVVAGLGSLAVPGRGLAAPVLATVVLALLFRPLKDRLQRGISRLLYGNREEPYVVLTRLGRLLAQAGETEDVLRTIPDTVASALHLPYASVELIASDGSTLRTAAVGVPTRDVVALPALSGSELVGILHLSPRATASGFETSEHALLDDLVEQATPALRALRLTAELQRSRETLVHARAEERRRMQGDLHDGVGPSLAVLLLRLAAAKTMLGRGETTNALVCLGEVEDQVRQTSSDVRELLVQLSSPLLDSLGLVGALEHQARQLDVVDGPRMSVDLPPELPRMPAAVEEAILAIASEAMANAVRHSHAESCRVRLRVSESVELSITDDGVGFRRGRPAGIGLSSMRRRADELGGHCVVSSPVSGGTSVQVTLPLRAPAPN